MTARRSRPSTFLEKIVATEADASPMPIKSRRDRIFDQACALAREDEAFRRDLLAVLRATGKGKRGAVAPLGERKHIEAAYQAAMNIIADSGKKPTKTAAIDMLAAGPFPERKSLDKLLRNKSPKKPGTK